MYGLLQHNVPCIFVGTFGGLEHVLLVGVAGGMPHFTDFYKHVRPGDVVVATPNQKGYMYIYCDNIKHDREHVNNLIFVILKLLYTLLPK